MASENLRLILGLDSGALVLIGTLIRTNTQPLVWKWALVLGLVSFVISILCCVLAFGHFGNIVLTHEAGHQAPSWRQTLYVTAATIGFATFVFGIIFLSLFIVRGIMA